MRNGSKSFSLAASLFQKKDRLAARYLYSWCRHCDDSIDNASGDEEANCRLQGLVAQTTAALRGQAVQEPAFVALRELCSNYSIPSLYPLELLEGMRMDVDRVEFRTWQDLDLYCYRVAGVVGLMMVHVMGVSSEAALKNALHSGLAMQMTNIARDIREDFAMGRIYIPEQWFRERGLARPTLTEPFQPDSFTSAVRDLVDRAEQHYTSGQQGLAYLPFRAALAVAAAQEIYREIGRVVVTRGDSAWESRTIVPLWRKIVLVGVASARVLATLPIRLASPWRPARLTQALGPGYEQPIEFPQFKQR